MAVAGHSCGGGHSHRAHHHSHPADHSPATGLGSTPRVAGGHRGRCVAARRSHRAAEKARGSGCGAALASAHGSDYGVQAGENARDCGCVVLVAESARGYGCGVLEAEGCGSGCGCGHGRRRVRVGRVVGTRRAAGRQASEQEGSRER